MCKEEIKQCTSKDGCGEFKPLSEFNKDKTCPGGYRNICRPCDNKTNAKWMEKNKDKRLDQQLQHKYNITLPYRNAQIEKQKGCCACCGKKCDKLVVDHDHTTGKFRGMLCHRCNTGLGQLGDDVPGLIRGLKYIVKCYIRNKFRKKDVILDTG